VTDQHLFWIASRAAGTVALLASSASLALGLAMGGRLTRRRGPDLRAAHEALALATMAAIVVHAGALLSDSFLHLGVADVAVPFVSGYAEPWTALGIVSGWALVALGLSYYARARIGVARWRLLHRFTALAWIGGLVHSLGEGSDAGTTWFLVAGGIVVVPAAALLVLRYRKPVMAGAR
jgi:sulfoxide reductase heme-binding subunit YedZ